VSVRGGGSGGGGGDREEGKGGKKRTRLSFSQDGKCAGLSPPPPPPAAVQRHSCRLCHCPLRGFACISQDAHASSD
jgi:hypothetical protein